MSSSILALSEGENHTLALTSNKHVLAVGQNSNFELGMGNVNYSEKPLLVPLLNDIIAIAAGPNNSMALSKKGEVFGWGNNQYGQTGKKGAAIPCPTPIQGLPPIKQIVAGSSATLALSDTGELWIWGLSGLTKTISAAQLVPMPEKIIGISGSRVQFVVLTQKGQLFTFKTYPYEQNFPPKLIPFQEKIVAHVDIVGVHFALDQKDNLHGWLEEKNIDFFNNEFNFQLTPHIKAISPTSTGILMKSSQNQIFYWTSDYPPSIRNIYLTADLEKILFHPSSRPSPEPEKAETLLRSLFSSQIAL